MIVSTISNKEATIQSFMRDPKFAEFLLKEVMADGDPEEIQEFQGLVAEARARVDEAKLAAAAV